ncbi:MAG: type II secretion system protein [Sedimentisphaerales bacterium]|nr:type II secretion system protein [Sedimentisphaerales bacterium]
MIALNTRNMGPPAHDAAFTIVEAVISTIIVAFMLVAALSTVGASRCVQQETSLADRGRQLAESLMAEILRQDYQDTGKPISFGPEADESTATRTDFDDVDDYNGWAASPPTAKDGTVLANASGWTRTVVVVWIEPRDPAAVKSSETYAKRITVTAKYNNVSQATLVAVRTNYR